jgi:hypothetical protein
VTFAPTPYTYPVNFSETGLPLGSSWSVILGTDQNSTTSLTNSFRMPNGTYSFLVGPPPGYLARPANGTVVVMGGPSSVLIAFAPGPSVYAVLFVEAGLPAGTGWAAVLNGVTERSTAPSIAFFLPNGTGYRYTVPNLTGYTPSPVSGSLTVNGSPVAVLVQFTAFVEPLFPLWFNETGLPIGYYWYVIVQGTGSYGSQSSNGSTTQSIGFALPAGFSGTYLITPLHGYVASPTHGAVLVPVPGAPVTVLVQITLLGNGTPNPPVIALFGVYPGAAYLGSTIWFQTTVEGGALPLAFAYAGLPPGCLSQNLSEMGCAPTAAGNTTVTVTVTDTLGRSDHAEVTVVIIAPPREVGPSPSSTFLGLPPSQGYALFSVLLLVGVIGVYLDLRRRSGGSLPVAPPGPA